MIKSKITSSMSCGARIPPILEHILHIPRPELLKTVGKSGGNITSAKNSQYCD
jgi:hypothetical protein